MAAADSYLSLGHGLMIGKIYHNFTQLHLRS